MSKQQIKVIGIFNQLFQFKKRPVTSELPSVGVDDIQIKADRAGEIHVFANPEDNVVVHQEDKSTGEVGSPGYCNTKNINQSSQGIFVTCSQRLVIFISLISGEQFELN